MYENYKLIRLITSNFNPLKTTHLDLCKACFQPNFHLTTMNAETLRKMLCSDLHEDNLLALNILRGIYPHNWGGFLMELDKLCHGYFYNVKREMWSIYGLKNVERQEHLKDKYFETYEGGLLKSRWADLID